jgi:phage tail-like protein
MPAPMFPQDAHRSDPYRTFKFQVLIDGTPVAGLRKMSALKRTTEAAEWRVAGGPNNPRKLPGGTKYEAITLEMGLSHDPVFELWANAVNNIEGDSAMTLLGFRKNLVINVLNLQGNVALSYEVRSAWVSEYQALPDLDAGATSTVGIQSIKIEHEGWSRREVDPPTHS